MSALLNMGGPERFIRARRDGPESAAARQDLGDAHAALATIKRLFEWDWAGAEAEYLTALVLSSDAALIHQAYGVHLAALAEPRKPCGSCAAPRKSNHYRRMVNADIAWGLYVARNFKARLNNAWKVLAMEPKFGAAQYTLGLAYEQMGMTEEAIVELRNARTCAGDQPAVLAGLAHAHACAGNSCEKAAEWLGGSRADRSAAGMFRHTGWR